MTKWNERVRVPLGAFSVELPAVLVKRQGSAVDSEAAGFEGGGLTVVVDQGPFADRLTSCVGRPDYREEATEIAGVSSRVVFFRTPAEGTYTVAAHRPGPNGLTVVVSAAESVPEQVARDIVKSVEPLG
jgi:hypothetical protein